MTQEGAEYIDHHKSLTISSSEFVKRYVGIISLVSSILIVSILWGFYARTTNLLQHQLVHEARAFFEEIVKTRLWIIKQEGVYVKMRPGMRVDPALAKIPGLKTVITDQAGDKYLLRSHAAITNMISELGQEERLFGIKITSLHPSNQMNTPDSFERISMERFDIDTEEIYQFDETPGGILFRYIAPLITKEECIKCHGAQGYDIGDIRGAISITIPANAIAKEMTETKVYTVISAIVLLSLLITVIIYISQHFIKDLKISEDRLFELATTDSLTGLLNRGEGIRRFQQEISHSLRTGQPLSIIIIDIDYFKKINDNFGHQVGDKVIQLIARTILSTLRNYDTICRYGGEEFLVILPSTDLDKAIETAERLRKTVEKTKSSEQEHGAEVILTISLGVSALQPGDSLDGLVYRADNALYIAKEEGRNQVQFIA